MRFAIDDGGRSVAVMLHNAKGKDVLPEYSLQDSTYYLPQTSGVYFIEAVGTGGFPYGYTITVRSYPGPTVMRR